MKKYLLIPALALLTACGETKPTAIEVSDLGKASMSCFILRTPTMDEALNPFAGLGDLGGVMEELTKAPIKKGWTITSDDRSTASLTTKRDGVNYVCDFAKQDAKWGLIRSMWDGEEAYSLEAEEEVKKQAKIKEEEDKNQAQLKHDKTWKEKNWMGETYKFYALPVKGSDTMSQKELAINCKPDERGVMLNDFLGYNGGKELEFSFDGTVMTFGVSGGGSNSYLGNLVDSGWGIRTQDRVEVADKFIEALKDTDTVEVMGYTFVIKTEELAKIPCL